MRDNPTALTQSGLDRAAALTVLAFAVALSLFAIRNNDIWWLLATARRIFETKSFITEDPFTFTAGGSPWAPQSWLSALVFYVVHGAASAWGLIALRAILVAVTVGVTLRTLSRTGISWALAAPVVVVALLNSHTRFLVRAHLFEYLFVALLVWFLLTARERRGMSFFVLPVAMQLLWVNMHPSFILGPVLAAIFFAGEWAAGRMKGDLVRPWSRTGYDWRRVGLLLVLMMAACLVNPNPALLLTQPFGGEQRELLSRFTLEWRSPFDPALARGAFHPYYEILLGISALSILVSLKRMQLAPALLIVATAVLSFQAHRFRVEFALVSVPMALILLRASPVTASIRRWLEKGGLSRYAGIAGAVVAAVLIAAAGGRISIGEAIMDRYPAQAFNFVSTEGIAHRPFNTIGHGSYLVWHLYGERKSFIDGRNFSPEVYRDFLSCQTTDTARRGVAAKYDVDAFILPPIENSDAGIGRVHQSLVKDEAWSLCYAGRHAWIYVRDDSVDGGWLQHNAARVYNPLTLHNRPMRKEDFVQSREDLLRLVEHAPDYARTRVDLALVLMALGERTAADTQINRALEIDPANPMALDVQRRIQSSP
jgi:hypothetical protein